MAAVKYDLGQELEKTLPQPNPRFWPFYQMNACQLLCAVAVCIT